jgi:hypothetical protein
MLYFNVKFGWELLSFNNHRTTNWFDFGRRTLKDLVKFY